MEVKKILLKSLRLEKCFKSYSNNAEQKREVFQKFEEVWGTTMANHFLGKYDCAESLISALDNENLELFVNHF